MDDSGCWEGGKQGRTGKVAGRTDLTSGLRWWGTPAAEASRAILVNGPLRHPPVKGNYRCFQFGGTMNRAALNTHVKDWEGA